MSLGTALAGCVPSAMNGPLDPSRSHVLPRQTESLGGVQPSIGDDEYAARYPYGVSPASSA